MSDLVNGNFSSESGIVYVTDTKEYAKAEKSEYQAITGDKYEVVKMELFIVREKVN